MGVVYRARDLRLRRTVALKVLGAKLFPGEAARRRFILEAQYAASISHPNVATVFEIDQTLDATFIAMEYVPGQTLKDMMQKGPLREPGGFHWKGGLLRTRGCAPVGNRPPGYQALEHRHRARRAVL